MSGTLQPLIDGLRKLARGERRQFHNVAHDIWQIPRTPLAEAGDCASLLAGVAKTCARQIDRTHPESEQEMRGILLALSNVLQVEKNFAESGGEKPWYLKGQL